MSEKIQVYISTVSSNVEIKKHQQKIEMILSSKCHDVEYIDIAASEDAKKKMRELMGDPKGLPPQIFRGDKHLGDFQKFEDAVECEELEKFLQG